MTRREFCIAAVAATAASKVLAGKGATLPGKKKWYKGNLH